MVSLRKKSLVLHTTLAFGAAALVNAAFAGPPMHPPVIRAAIVNSVPNLDLRPPAAALESAAKALAVFPSYLHRQSSPAAEAPAREQSRLPGLHADTSNVPDREGMAGFAQRVHREGVPFARLWENKSALVSLGLNQRGKPGLWLVQKIP
jgi:hypothetical protein